MDQHVAITGASSGIGAAFAREFLRAGARVTLVARRRELLDVVARDAPAGRAHVAAHDLVDLAHACDWIAPAEEALGPIDVLINNAGVQIVAPTAGVAPEDGERLIALDLLAPLRLTRAVLPAMLARRAGTIVDIASMAALAPTPGMTHYNAAKAGLAAASEALRGELRGTGVHVVTVYPGIIDDTDLARSALELYGTSPALGWMPRASSAQLAARVRVAVERRTHRVIYPRSMTLARWFPGPTRWFMDRFTPRLAPAAP